MLRYRYGLARHFSSHQRPLKSAEKYYDRWKCKSVSELEFKPFADALVKVPGHVTGETENPPSLKHSLAHCLYQPMNIVPLQDDRTNVFNFTPFLEYLISVDDFNFDGLPAFVPPSEDVRLSQISKKMEKKYFSSTSSMTGLLSHLHFLISNFRPLNFDHLSRSILPQYHSFTFGARAATAVMLKRIDGDSKRFSISSDKSINKDIILSKLGHCLEALLTTDRKSFNKLYKLENNPPKNRKIMDHYHYATIGDFALRSQLDAFDPKLPGTGVFDLKTRAVAAIRHDLLHVENNDNFTGYEINRRFGSFESFEREFYELTRSTMLKYSLQARIGNMDGIFVAYHNITKMFGFQYIPQYEMNRMLHSNVDLDTRKRIKQRDDLARLLFGEEKYVQEHSYELNRNKVAQKVAEAEFNFSMQLISSVLRSVETRLAQNQHARIMLKTVSVKNHSGQKQPVLQIFVTPLENSEMASFENKKLESFLLEDDPSKMKGYINNLESIHSRLIKKTFCFVVEVEHVFENDVSEMTSKIPKYSLFDKSMKGFVNETMSNSSSNWTHPYFFYPEEVDNWNVRFTIKEVEDRSVVKESYQSCLSEQLTMLHRQGVAAEEPPEQTFESLKSDLYRLMNGRSLERRKQKFVDNEISTLQLVLRALAKKNAEKRPDASKRASKPVMWFDNTKKS